MSGLQIGVSVETGNDRNKVHPDQSSSVFGLLRAAAGSESLIGRGSAGLRRGLLISGQVSKVARKAQACGFLRNDEFDEVEEILMISAAKRKTTFGFSRYVLMQFKSFQMEKTQTPVLERFRFNMSFTGDLKEI